MSDVTENDLRLLRHMVGATGRDRRAWGYRNHFAPGDGDLEAMERLEAAGLVRRGEPYWNTYSFHATEAGLDRLGLGRVVKRRILSGVEG